MHCVYRVIYVDVGTYEMVCFVNGCKNILTRKVIFFVVEYQLRV